MGWGSGSNLMGKIILILEASGVFKHMTPESSVVMFEQLIDAFQDEDCDTLYECVGENEYYDRAYVNTNPEEDE